jgi:hypothetical protein
MRWNGRITDRMIAAHDRALGSPEYDEEDPEDEEEGTRSEWDDEPDLTDEELLERQEVMANTSEKEFLAWLGQGKEGKPV